MIYTTRFQAADFQASSSCKGIREAPNNAEAFGEVKIVIVILT